MEITFDEVVATFKMWNKSYLENPSDDPFSADDEFCSRQAKNFFDFLTKVKEGKK